MIKLSLELAKCRVKVLMKIMLSWLIKYKLCKSAVTNYLLRYVSDFNYTYNTPDKLKIIYSFLVLIIEIVILKTLFYHSIRCPLLVKKFLVDVLRLSQKLSIKNTFIFSVYDTWICISVDIRDSECTWRPFPLHMSSLHTAPRAVCRELVLKKSDFAQDSVFI